MKTGRLSMTFSNCSAESKLLTLRYCHWILQESYSILQALLALLYVLMC